MPLLRDLGAECAEGSCPSMLVHLLQGLTAHILGAHAGLDGNMINREMKRLIEVATMFPRENLACCADGIPTADLEEVLQVVQDVEAREKLLQGHRPRSKQSTTSLARASAASSLAHASLEARAHYLAFRLGDPPAFLMEAPLAASLWASRHLWFFQLPGTPVGRA